MNTNNLLKGLTAMIIIATLSGVTAYAGSRGQQGPPPEAIEACKTKQEGDTVTFSGRGGESLSATCQTIEGELVAVPAGHKNR